MGTLQVLSVASEIFPLIKTGGLADVAGALPKALKAQDVEMHSLVPGYPAVVQAGRAGRVVWSDDAFFGGPASIVATEASGLRLFVLDAPHLFARLGNPYTGPDGQDWPDNPQRFAALAYAGALLGQGCAAGFSPAVVHAHDWQAGLTPAYLAFGEGDRPASVMTVHNLAFQGQVSASLLAELRLPAASYTPDGLEYYGAIGMLKAGLRYADRLTTVSPTYAAEICSGRGMGMDGLLHARADRLVGILNGIDTAIWNPQADPALPAPFSAADPGPRRSSKAALQKRFGLRQERGTLLIGVVSRLSHQKGLDVLLDALPVLHAHGMQLAVLGSGDPALQVGFASAANAAAGEVGFVPGYDEGLAHLLQAGCDAILVPSRFEPCGLTQLCALRYGALPVVSRVGGLADTVIDANAAALASGVATGLQFEPVSRQGLATAIGRLTALWADKHAWASTQANGMRADFGWAGPARLYAALYRGLTGRA